MSSEDTSTLPSNSSSGILAAVAAGLFVVSFALHLFQGIRTRTWFMIPFLLGILLEAGGFLLRTKAAFDPADDNRWSFLLMFLWPYLAPTLIAISMFVELGYIIRMCAAENCSIVRVRWLTLILVFGELLTLIAQVVGGVLIASPSVDANALITARYINIGSFILQFIFLIFFLFAAAVFQQRYGKIFRLQRVQDQLPWQRHMSALYFAVSMIMIRCAYHLIDYITTISALAGQEWPLYGLDGLPLLLVAFAFNWVHPSEVKALLRRRGLICTRLFHFERPAPPGKYLEMYSNNNSPTTAAAASRSRDSLRSLFSDAEQLSHDGMPPPPPVPPKDMPSPRLGAFSRTGTPSMRTRTGTPRIELDDRSIYSSRRGSAVSHRHPQPWGSPYLESASFGAPSPSPYSPYRQGSPFFPPPLPPTPSAASLRREPSPARSASPYGTYNPYRPTSPYRQPSPWSPPVTPGAMQQSSASLSRLSTESAYPRQPQTRKTLALHLTAPIAELEGYASSLAAVSMPEMPHISHAV